MGRKRKYPTPEEARREYEQGVERAKDEWVEQCRKGASDYEKWFEEFASEVYPVIAGLPSPEGLTIEQKVDARVKPVAKAISLVAREYRREKLKEIEEKLRAPAARAPALARVVT